MFAVLINALLILVGSALGLLLKGKLPERFLTILVQCLGLCVLSIGISSAIGTQNTLCVVVCLVVGTLLGEGINIEKRLDTCGEWLHTHLIKGEGSASSFTEGFVTASVLFCVGAMAIVGAIEAGVNQDYSILVSKAVIDGVTAISLTTALGIGVAFSALPILLYEGGITLLAVLAAGFLQQALITEMSAVGGCIIIGIGLNMLKLRKEPIRVGNMLPAVFLPLLYLPLADWLSRLAA